LFGKHFGAQEMDALPGFLEHLKSVGTSEKSEFAPRQAGGLFCAASLFISCYVTKSKVDHANY
jgi:hypothetical protein